MIAESRKRVLTNRPGVVTVSPVRSQIQQKVAKQAAQYSSTVKSAVESSAAANVRKIMANQINALNQSIIGVLQSPAVQMAEEIRNSVTKALRDIQLSIPKELVEYRRKFVYLEKLRKVNWPLFLEDDTDLIEKVLSVPNGETENMEEAVKQIAFSYCNHAFIERMYTDWSSSDAINQERLPILNEAILNYKEERYFSCTSLLMEQLMGLIADTFHYYDVNEDEKPEIEDLAGICDFISLSEKNVLTTDKKTKTLMPIQVKKLKEKGQLVYIIGMLGARGMIYWRVAAEYISTVVLVSGSPKKEILDHHPLRNKICHGEQLDYGTREHALKAILAINLIIEIANAVKYRSDKKVS